jgi:two-component system, LuxR family, response regulator FixJ
MIAIVDDDQAVRDAVSELLQVSHLDNEVFANAEAFLQGYMPGRYGCLITDLRMGRISGLSLLRRVKSRDPLLPVILLTAESAEAREQGLLEGAHAVLAKPVDGVDLVDHVLKAIGQDD